MRAGLQYAVAALAMGGARRACLSRIRASGTLLLLAALWAVPSRVTGAQPGAGAPSVEPEKSTALLLATAQAARIRADSLGLYVADWREARRRLPRDTVQQDGATVSVWRPWAPAARRALAAAADTMHAIFGSAASATLADLHVDVTPMLARDGTPIVSTRNGAGELPAVVTATGGRYGTLPPLRGAVTDTSLTRFLVDAATRIVSARYMDAPLRRWIDEEPSLMVPTADERKGMYRRSIGRAVGISTRQCLLGWLQQCPRVFGLRGNAGDALPFQRALLLRHALIMGGPGAYARLMRDTTLAMQDRLADAAGQPVPAILASWHADLVTRWRPDVPHVPGGAIASSLLCCGMLGFLFVRSRR